MKKEEYLKIVERLEKIKEETKKLDGVSRTRKVRTKLKSLKRQEKEYTKLLKDFNGTFITEDNRESNINNELNESEKNNEKKYKGFFKGIKRRVLATAALIGTAASIIAGGISFSASAFLEEDPNVDKYNSFSQSDIDNQAKKVETKNSIENENIKNDDSTKKEDKGIRVSYMDFDTFVYNSKFTIGKNAQIYSNIYDVYNDCNGLKPYYAADCKRVVKGVTFDHEGQLEYYEIDSEGSYDEMHSLLSDGGKVVSIVTSTDGNNYEGAYNISDVDMIYVNENTKVLKK